MQDQEKKKERFCSNCMKYQPDEGGMIKQTANKPRWRCAKCTERKRTYMKGKEK
jgi:hypothetical protein